MQRRTFCALCDAQMHHGLSRGEKQNTHKVKKIRKFYENTGNV